MGFDKRGGWNKRGGWKINKCGRGYFFVEGEIFQKQ